MSPSWASIWPTTLFDVLLIRRFALGAALTLIGCGSVGGGGAEFIEMPGVGNFSMIVPTGAHADDLPGLAKEKCGSMESCSVFAWPSRVQAARALPMTDREMRNMVFAYKVNRATGFEQIMWNCKIYKRPNPDQCLATDDGGES